MPKLRKNATNEKQGVFVSSAEKVNQNIMRYSVMYAAGDMQSCAGKGEQERAKREENKRADKKKSYRKGTGR